MKTNSIIVRYGEISLKGRNRYRFEMGLKNGLMGFLRDQGIPFTAVKIRKGRIYVQGITAAARLEKVLGVHSYSRALKIEKNFDMLKERVLNALPEIERAASFRVSCQRIDKEFHPDSMAVEKVLGDILRKKGRTPVNLDHPDRDLGVEIGEDGIYLFLERVRGFGGFPYGIAGKLVSLVSSGIDSPVATFLMMKRGVEPVLLHFRISESDAGKFQRIREKLEEYTSGRAIAYHVIDRDDLFQGRFHRLFRDGKFHQSICILCKYLMHREAGEIARRERAWGVITGDNLGQVASQTLKNLNAYQNASRMPVYSPLIGFEKQETINLARRIGTYELSILKSRGCTPPSSPATGISQKAFQKLLKESGLG